MTRHIPTFIAALLVIGLLSSCSSSDVEPEDREAAVQNSASPSSADEPETGEPEQAEATADQWASFVAVQDAMLEPAWTAWEDEDCTPSLLRDDVTCYAMLLSLMNVAKTIALNADMATNPKHADFIGEPSAEVDKLVDDLVAAAQAASDAAEPVSEACPEAEGCTSAAFQFDRSVDKLRLTIAAWEPFR